MKTAVFVGEYPGYSLTFVDAQIRALLEDGNDVEIYAERKPVGRVPKPPEFLTQVKVHYELMPESFVARLKGLVAGWSWRWPAFRALNPWSFGRDAISLRSVWSAQAWPSGQYDFVLCHFGPHGRKAVLARAAGLIEGPVVTVFHGNDLYTYPKQFRFPIYKPLIEKGDLFFCISERGREQLQKMGCPGDRIEVLRMGVDTELFCPGDCKRGERVRILTVARLVESKGICTAMKAMAGIEFDYEWHLVGTGPMEEELRQEASQLGVSERVRFRGALSVAEVREELQLSDLFVLTPEEDRNGEIEGIPVALMEAMACELAVVSTRHSGIEELIEDGCSGLLAMEGDIDSVRAAIQIALADRGRREALGRAARQKVKRDFDLTFWNRRLIDRAREISREWSS